MSDTTTSFAGPVAGDASTTIPDNDAAAGASERDSRGRYSRGNPGGPGNPFARRVAGMRQAMMDAVSEEDIAVISKKMVELAREGDVAAARLVFSYVVGKPQATEDPDRLDEKEWRQYVNETVRQGEMEAVVGGMSATLACTIAGAAVPAMQAEAEQTLLAGLLDPVAAEDEEAEEHSGEAERPAGKKRDVDGAATGAAETTARVEGAAARVAAMLLRIDGQAAEPVQRAANGQAEGGKRAAPLAPPSSVSPKGLGQPKSDD